MEKRLVLSDTLSLFAFSISLFISALVDYFISENQTYSKNLGLLPVCDYSFGIGIIFATLQTNCRMEVCSDMSKPELRKNIETQIAGVMVNFGMDVKENINPDIDLLARNDKATFLFEIKNVGKLDVYDVMKFAGTKNYYEMKSGAGTIGVIVTSGIVTDSVEKFAGSAGVAIISGSSQDINNKLSDYLTSGRIYKLSSESK